jgi:hypothetical protein
MTNTSRAEFVASALKAEQEVLEHGLVYEADAVHQYFRDKLAGRKPEPLEPVQLRIKKPRRE